MYMYSNLDFKNTYNGLIFIYIWGKSIVILEKIEQNIIKGFLCAAKRKAHNKTTYKVMILMRFYKRPHIIMINVRHIKIINYSGKAKQHQKA